MTVEQGRNYMYHQQHLLVFSKSVKFQVVLLWDHERRRSLSGYIRFLYIIFRLAD